MTKTYKFKQLLSENKWLSPGYLTVDENGIITSVSNSEDRYDDHFDGICIPGIPNLHSHAFQRAMAGLTEISGAGENNFWTWQKVMYDFLGKLNPEDVEAIAAQLYMEMLKGGYTAVAEFHYVHHDKNGAFYGNPAEMSLRVIKAASDVGIRYTHLPVLYAYGGFGSVAPEPGQRRFLHSVDQFELLLKELKATQEKNQDFDLGMAFHSLRAVSPEMIDDVLAVKPAGPIHIHISEQTQEVDQCVKWSGKRPVQWLLDHVDINEQWCLIHATHLTRAETEDLAKSGAVVGLCPTTEANLGDGLFSLESFLKSGGSFGIGSDSNTSVDVAEELRLLEYGQRLFLRRRNVGALVKNTSSGATLFNLALEGGAKALGSAVQYLVPGKRADFVVLDGTHPILAARKDQTILDSWIFTGGRELITDVFVSGQHLVNGGKHINQQMIENNYRNSISRLMS